MAGTPPFPPNFLTVYDLLAAFYGGTFISTPVESDSTIGTTAVEIGSDQPGIPITIFLSNTGSTNIAVSFLAGVTITTGILLLPGGTYSLDWYYDGDLVSLPLWAISSAAGGTLHVIERFLAGA